MNPTAFLAGAALLAGFQQTPSRPLIAATSDSHISADSPADLLLLDVLYRHMRLDTAMPGYQDSAGRRYLPLKQLSASLGFRVRVYPARRFASGFLSAPSDTFEFDGMDGYTKHRGQGFHFPVASSFERDGDIFVEEDLLQVATGLRFKFLLSRMELHVDSAQKLNVERQWIERRQLADAEPALRAPKLESINAPYCAWTRPAFNVQAYSNSDPDAFQAKQSSQLGLDGSGDLLYMTARYRFLADSTGKPTALLTLSRQDADSRLGGPLRATSFEIGDLHMPPIGLFDRARTGLGLTVTNFSQVGSGTTSTPDIEGQAVADAIVEVYSGDQLVAATKAGKDGHYSFSQLPLEAGANTFKVVILEGQGGVRQEERVVFGGLNGPKKGQDRYRLTAATVGQTLLNAQAYKGSAASNRKELIGESQVGLTDSSWLSITSAQTWTQAGSSAYGGAGYHAWTRSVLWEAQGLFSSQGGFADTFGASRRFGGSMVSLSRTHAGKGFDPILLPEISTQASKITSLRVDGAARPKNLPLAYGLGLDKLEGANDATLLRERLSGKAGALFFSNTNAVRIDTGPFEEFGSLQLRRQLNNEALRLDIGYGLGATRAFQTGLFALDHRVAAETFTRYGVDYDYSRKAPFGPISSIYRTLGPLAVGCNVGLGERGSLRTSLLLSTAVSGDGTRASFEKPGAAEFGTARIRVFLDRDQSGRVAKGNPSIANVGLLVNGRPVPYRTNPDGTCVLDRLAPNLEVQLSLNEDTFENPNWVAEKSGVRLTPRPGRRMTLDFPVLETAEVEGSATPPSAIVSHPGLTAELLDGAGKAVDTSVLDSAGAFVFSRVRPGTWTLRLVDLTGITVGSIQLKVFQGGQFKADIPVRP